MSSKIPRKALAIQARKKRTKGKPRVKHDDKKRTLFRDTDSTENMVSTRVDNTQTDSCPDSDHSVDVKQGDSNANSDTADTQSYRRGQKGEITQQSKDVNCNPNSYDKISISLGKGPTAPSSDKTSTSSDKLSTSSDKSSMSSDKICTPNDKSEIGINELLDLSADGDDSEAVLISLAESIPSDVECVLSFF
ncbi:hypothetical protein Btru_037987 [Bulinus truncatus]|nr:hypothetical protein Btru_037987 [Bulinus truncatus]